jgi:hypothetical protein
MARTYRFEAWAGRPMPRIFRPGRFGSSCRLVPGRLPTSWPAKSAIRQKGSHHAQTVLRDREPPRRWARDTAVDDLRSKRQQSGSIGAAVVAKAPPDGYTCVWVRWRAMRSSQLLSRSRTTWRPASDADIWSGEQSVGLARAAPPTATPELLLPLHRKNAFANSTAM